MKYWYNKDIQKVNEYKHLIMLDLETNELERLSKGDDFVEEFNNRITELNKKETFQSAMTYEEDQKLILNTEKSISFEEGIEKGLEQGIQESKIDIAKSMLKEGISLDMISRCTGLTVQNIIDITNKQ